MTDIVLNAHLLSKSAGYRKAGIHRYMYNLLWHLPQVDESFSYRALANHELDVEGITTVKSRFDTTNPGRRIFWEQAIQPFVLRSLKPDLYHALAFVGPYNIKSPFVVTVYDLSFLRFPEILTRTRRLYLKTFTRSTCNRATRVIAISQSTADDLAELYRIPPAKIDIAYPGVSEEFHRVPEAQIAEFRQQRKLPERFFLYIGTLEPRKNLPMLIRAYAGLTQSERDAYHLVLGGGKGWFYEEIFDTIARLNLTETVHTPGFIPSDELVMWYNAAHAFVYPALYEGFGMPIVEALACGKPVIASNTSSMCEAGGKVSVLIPPDDEQAWTDALRTAIYDNNQDTEARQRWARTFSWQRTARQTVESYRNAQNGR
jgi:glycosyltransferase involved in cell wall biosynthesis